MKMLIILLLSAATAHAQELTADTPAIEPSLLSQRSRCSNDYSHYV